MQGTDAATQKLYATVERGIGALPQSAQPALHADLDAVKAASATAAQARATLAQTAASVAAQRPAADAALHHAMQPKLLGMKPSTVILGAVAVGALAVAATKLIHRGKAPLEPWTQRVGREQGQGRQI